jgi:hypothetical protein
MSTSQDVFGIRKSGWSLLFISNLRYIGHTLYTRHCPQKVLLILTRASTLRIAVYHGLWVLHHLLRVGSIG